MTLAMVANELRALSKRVEDGFAQVDERFAHVEARFEQFAETITTAFKINLERVEAKLDAVLDDTRELKRRFDALDRRNTEEHQLMQAQIDDLDSRLPRRGRRRPS